MLGCLICIFRGWWLFPGGNAQLFAVCSLSLPKPHVESAAVHKGAQLTPKESVFGKVASSCCIRSGIVRGITCSITAVPRKVRCLCLSVTRQDTGSSPALAHEGFDFSKVSRYFPVGIKLTFSVLWSHEAVHAFLSLF